MKRIGVLLLIAGWLGAVAWYWRGNVPLAATNWARKTPDAEPTTLNANEEMPMTHLRWADETRTRTVRCGPLEFWSFPECVKTREMFTREDDFIAGPLAGTREVMIRRKGRLLVVDSETGETIGELPDVPKTHAFAMVPGKRQVVVSGGREVSLIEFGGSEPLWTLSSCTLRGHVAGDLAVVSQRAASAFGRSQTRVVRLSTGEIDSRFDHLGRIGDIRLPGDGRLAIVWTMPSLLPTGAAGVPAPSKSVVCDAVTGEVRWTLPNSISTPGGAIFWADDREVQASVFTPGSPSVIRRWRASDGEQLADPRPEECGPLWPRVSTDRRYLLHCSGNTDSQFHRAVARFNSFSATYGLRFFININPEQWSVREVATGRVVGPLAPKATNVWLPKDGGLVSIDQNFIRYYRMPPRRDYWWLAMWGLLPPAAVAVLFRSWRRWRMRRSRVMAS